MDGKDAIIARIIGDAENKAEVIKRTSEERRTAVLAEAEEWAENYTNAQEQILKEDVENLITRRETLARLDVRKNQLAEKRKAIGEVIDSVLDKLCNLPKEKYLLLVGSLMEKYADKNDKVILPNDSPLTESDIKSLKIYRDMGLGISPERGNFKGGVKLSNEICDKDLSFVSLIEADKEDIEREINGDLFGTENL